jgi:hypothetical protein
MKAPRKYAEKIAPWRLDSPENAGRTGTIALESAIMENSRKKG